MTNKPVNPKKSPSGDVSQAHDQGAPNSDLEASSAGDSPEDHRPENGQSEQEDQTEKNPEETTNNQDNQNRRDAGNEQGSTHASGADSADDSGSDSVSDSVAAAAEIAALKDQLLRAMAETENLRRRSVRELEDRIKYAPGGLARDLLSVADNLDRALSSLDAEARAADERLEQFATGIEAITRDFLAAFEKNGIRRLDPLDQPFNPSEHEAMLKIQDDTRPPGTVVQVMQSGYILRDRLLRPAMVGVAEGGASPGRVDEKA